MTALALFTPIIGLAVVLALQLIEARVLTEPVGRPSTPHGAPAAVPTPFR